MNVRVLGAAAGGGFPQWNCRCTNCLRLRQGSLNGRTRTQAQLAVSADGKSWVLLNASPDLRAQIEATPELWPASGLRHSPISSIVLTSAELDAVLGLLLLREFYPLQVYTTPSVRRILTEDNSMFAMLHRVEAQIRWHDLPASGTLVIDGLTFETLSEPSGFPGFVSQQRAATLNEAEAGVGVIVSDGDGARLAFVPGCADANAAILQRLATCDTILFDGTFWSDDELIRVLGGAKRALEMGHLPIGGEQGSLRKLASLTRQRKIYIHVNNTNPILDEDSSEFGEATRAGWKVAADGDSFLL
jgi:pyrroloquinoline quinone biosynthesis protein B